MVLAVAIAVALSAPTPRFKRFVSRTVDGRSNRGFLPAPPSSTPAVTPFFSFAPAGGAGTGGNCTCAQVTDATGTIPLTMSRATEALCATGSTFKQCAADEPRIRGGGYLMEEAATNLLVRSEEFDDGAWIKTNGGGAAAPTVTTGQADPLGGTTAERMTFGACSGFNAYSVAVQVVAVPTNTAGSIYVKGATGSGQLGVYSQLGFPGLNTPCNYNSTTWVKCANLLAGAADSFGIGCMNYSTVTGAADTGDADVFVWRAQAETGTYTTSSIKTVATSVARAADTQLEGTLPQTVGPGNFCVSGSQQKINIGSTNEFVILTDNSSDDVLAGTTSTTNLRLISGPDTTNSTITAISTTLHRLIWSNVGGVGSATWDGAAVTAPASGAGQVNDIVLIGSINSLVSNVQVGLGGCN